MNTTTTRSARRGSAGRGSAREPQRGSPDRRRRSRPSRRRALVRRWVAVLVVVGVVAGVVALLFSPLLSVRSVAVSGTSRLPVEQVRSTAKVPVGSAMLSTDTGAIADRVAGLAPVDSVQVSRSWPSTIDIRVTERTPVAWTRAPNGSVQLVDRDGVAFASAPAPPRGRIELRGLRLRPGDPRTAAALDVLSGLSQRLKAKTAAVAANSPGDVRLSLRGGKTVKWGDAGQQRRKNRVAVALLTRDGTVYDVATPGMPTVR